MAAAEGQSALKALQEGTDAKLLATERDLNWTRREGVSRSDASIDAPVLKRAFQLGRPAADEPVYGGVVLPSGDYAVISLTSVEDGDPGSSTKAARDALRASLERGYGQDVYGGFLRTLRASASIEIFAENLE